MRRPTQPLSLDMRMHCHLVLASRPNSYSSSTQQITSNIMHTHTIHMMDIKCNFVSVYTKHLCRRKKTLLAVYAIWCVVKWSETLSRGNPDFDIAQRSSTPTTKSLSHRRQCTSHYCITQ